MPKKILIAVGAVIAALGGALILPSGTTASSANDVIFREAHIDSETLAIIQRACQNCHSQNTAWPWYGHVAPVSWILAHDVRQARSHMNLSKWPDYSTDERLQLLSAIGSAARNQVMPPQRYLLLHPEARLSDGDRQQIYRWTRKERRRISTVQTPAAHSNSQLRVRLARSH